MNTDISNKEFERAQKVLPGGVNSPVRAFKSVGLNPIFIDSAKGSTITDVDGNTYIDYVGSWGPMLFGHADEDIIKSVQNAAIKGTSYGAPTIIESEVAELIIDLIPSIEKVRMVNSGTEATMSAIRLARGYTSRQIIIKFDGGYHGHGDSFLIKAGSGAATLGLPDSPGVLNSIAESTLNAQYNNLESVEELFKSNPENIAAVIVEPIAGNMGCVPPTKGFLEGLRELTTKYGALLIFDEVMTGFRVSSGGAQKLYNIDPDLTTLGKIIGGGLPVGAYGGKNKFMSMIAPEGPIYQAGTLSGNPLAMAAGKTMLEKIKNNTELYTNLDNMGERLENGLLKGLKEAGIDAVINRVGGMMTLFFTKNTEVNNFDDAKTSDTSKFAKYFKLSLENGIYLGASQFEAGFISAVHTNEDIDRTIEAAKKAFIQL